MKNHLIQTDTICPEQQNITKPFIIYVFKLIVTIPACPVSFISSPAVKVQPIDQIYSCHKSELMFFEITKQTRFLLNNPLMFYYCIHEYCNDNYDLVYSAFLIYNRTKDLFAEKLRFCQAD